MSVFLHRMLVVMLLLWVKVQDYVSISSKLPQTVVRVVHKQQVLISHSARVQEVQDQGAGRFRIWQGFTSCSQTKPLLCVSSPGRKGKNSLCQPPFISVLISFTDIHSHDLIDPRKFHMIRLNLEVLVRSSHEFGGGVVHKHSPADSSCVFLLWKSS